MAAPPPDEIPAELKAFLFSCIDAVEQVELLVLLRQSNRGWTVRAASAELGVSDSSTRHHLETLAARGLVHITIGEEASYSYAPKRPALGGYVDQLLEHYAHSRTTILRLIASGPRRGMKRFADAFKLRDPE